MFMRCAYFVGRPVRGKEAELHARLTDALTMYQGFDKIRSVQLLLAKESEEGAPDIYATLQLCFAEEAELQAALASPFRQQMRAYFVDTVFPPFEGSVKHINHAVSDRSGSTSGVSAAG